MRETDAWVKSQEGETHQQSRAEDPGGERERTTAKPEALRD